MIEVDGLVAGYTPGVDILHGVSLSVGAVEIVSILGPNGCGKSTLLKAIAGFLLPRTGTVKLQGVDLAREPVHRKVRLHGVGYVPQTDNVFGALTVRENLMLGGQGMSSFPREARIDELCEQYPVLRRRYRTPAAALSGGERQIDLATPPPPASPSSQQPTRAASSSWREPSSAIEITSPAPAGPLTFLLLAARAS
ncbi:ATP-binding cassette domain-containing protein [Paraburkholderia tropica]|uniref:ATP-binding cassette domain-containing protein n=1 Tax=Paraburkholderia tropica TaxID=92647 RepID=UPI003015CAB1